ncbi:hypothetical protein RvY_01521 [Ramazzottius varieornatus]|uniref:Uncharacterized protein n=1 Tax=Ramazzottius varieornatus TaxID=947166 RepID=A0A1D1UKG8_RAMVA|nr:hypothetical protein RvY_01521 [Ramazzottius varieornatus]
MVSSRRRFNDAIIYCAKLTGRRLEIQAELRHPAEHLKVRPRGRPANKPGMIVISSGVASLVTGWKYAPLKITTIPKLFTVLPIIEYRKTSVPSTKARFEVLSFHAGPLTNFH